MKTQHYKLLAVLTLAMILSCAPISGIGAVRAQTPASSAANVPGAQFYSFLVAYDAKSSVLKPANDPKFPLDVTTTNFTKDTGTGSQFYAKVLDSDNKYKTFTNKTDKFYLGDWKAQMITYIDGFDANKKPTRTPKTVDTANIKVSVPYFPGGKFVEIYDAKNNKPAMRMDVSKFAQVSAQKVAAVAPALKTPAPISTSAKVMNFMKQWIWAIIAVAVLILLGLAIFLFFRIRMKRETESLGAAPVINNPTPPVETPQAPSSTPGNIQFK
jgi:hypothetical protein